MKDASALKRSVLRNLTLAAAIGLSSARTARATLLFDNMTYSTPPGGVTATSSTPNYWMGDGYSMNAGAVDITGFDVFPLNNSGINYTSIKGYIDVWGTVNMGTVSATAPAFSNELGSYVFTSTGNFSTGFYYSFQNASAGSAPGITLTTPLAIPGTTIGLTFNYQGSTDSVTYNSSNNFTSIIAYNHSASTGAEVFNGYYRNAANENNGNIISPLRTLGFTSQTIGVRVYGDVTSATPDNWNSSSGGAWETQSSETTNPRWSLGAPPGGGADAIFNLSSAGYTVNISTGVNCNNLMVQNDKVSIDLRALNSRLGVLGTLSVGVTPAGGAPATGALTLTNSGLFFGDNGAAVIPVVEAKAIVIGANGGTGNISTTPLVYLYSDNDTAIGAGSSIALQAGSNFSSYTLTIAGSSNAWTGKLDIGSSDVDLRNASLGTVSNQIKSGYNNGAWNGQGIISSAAHADSTHLTAIGVVLNNNGAGSPIFGTNTSRGTFNSIDPSPLVTSVLLRYTYYGDANLDGVVDGSDYTRIDNGFLNQLSGWYNGDFNYDGVVDGSDYTLIDNAFNTQNGPSGLRSGLVRNGGSGVQVDPIGNFNQTALVGGSPVAESYSGATADEAADPLAHDTAEIAAFTGSASVPEPASLGLIAVAVPLLCRRARRLGK